MKTVLLLLVLVASWQVMAIPAFSRKLGVTCTTCHTAFPMLNQTGRTFKERGYRLPDENKKTPESMQNHLHISDSLVLEKMLPLAIRAQTIPADLAPSNPDTASGIQYKLEPIHDLALLGFGNFFQYGSFMIIAEAGAPDDSPKATAFDFGVSARLGAHPSVYFNMAGGYAPLFSIDPYPSLMGIDDPITLHDRRVLGVTFGGDMAISFADPMPFLSIYGRAGPFYYCASLTSAQNTIAGVNPRVGEARLAFDITDSLEVGAFGLGGISSQPDSTESTLWLAGIDTNWSTQEYIFSAIGRVTGGETDPSGQDVNWGASAEMAYMIQKDSLPFLMPIARLEWLQSNAGNTNLLSGLLGFSAFVRQNIRLGIDASMDLVPAQDTPRQWRTSLYADLVF